MSPARKPRKPRKDRKVERDRPAGAAPPAAGGRERGAPRAGAASGSGGALRPGELEVRPGAAPLAAELPRCAIVILNLNGRHHLKPCFETLAELDYPRERYEVLLVDNGSTDGSAAEMRRDHGWVRLIENPRNVGFSAGCNQGAAAAPDAEVLVFLNNDMRVERPWLRELVAPLVRGECAAATSKMLSWDGKLMNSAGGGMNFHGIGIQRGYLEPPDARFDVFRKTLFACGGAMAMDAALFRRLGGFDEEFFAYYEDVDLGWRTWLAGEAVWYVPTSVCYHHHSSTSRRLPIEMIRLLQVRNPMLACFKNYDPENLARVLPALLALAVRRAYLMTGGVDQRGFRIEEATFADPGPLGRLFERARRGLDATLPVRRVAVADLLALNDLLGRFEHWRARRAQVQALRRVPDAEIFRLFLKPLWCIEDEPAYRSLQGGLVDLLGLDRLFGHLEEPGCEPRP